MLVYVGTNWLTLFILIYIVKCWDKLNKLSIVANHLLLIANYSVIFTTSLAAAFSSPKSKNEPCLKPVIEAIILFGNI